MRSLATCPSVCFFFVGLSFSFFFCDGVCACVRACLCVRSFLVSKRRRRDRTRVVWDLPYLDSAGASRRRGWFGGCVQRPLARATVHTVCVYGVVCAHGPRDGVRTHARVAVAARRWLPSTLPPVMATFAMPSPLSKPFVRLQVALSPPPTPDRPPPRAHAHTHTHVPSARVHRALACSLCAPRRCGGALLLLRVLFDAPTCAVCLLLLRRPAVLVRQRQHGGQQPGRGLVACSRYRHHRGGHCCSRVVVLQ